MNSGQINEEKEECQRVQVLLKLVSMNVTLCKRGSLLADVRRREKNEIQKQASSSSHLSVSLCPPPIELDF
jgi:hypothetical protein